MWTGEADAKKQCKVRPFVKVGTRQLRWAAPAETAEERLLDTGEIAKSHKR